ncbi:MAG: MMPL family transporter [Rhodobiaceae bacterium]|nr:MMPL family transporter [Rhodobiaceae bacterium]
MRHDDEQGLPNGAAARALAGLAAWSVRNRWLVIVLSVLMLAGGAVGALRLTFDPDARVYFSKDAPERVAYDAIEARYGGRRDVIAVLRATEANVDEAQLRAAAEAAAEAARKVADVIEVGGDIAGGDGGIAMHAEKQPPIATFTIAISGVAASAYDTVAALQKTVDAATAGQGVEVLFTGGPAQEAASMDAIKNDLWVFVPIEAVLIAGLLLVTLGSLSATLALLCVLAVATAATMGAIGWLGLELNGVTSATPSALLGLSVATSVHVILGWQHGLRTARGRQTALARSVRLNAAPITLATLTTVISFACLNLADSPAFRTFGTMVGAGLTLTMVLSFSLLPALVSIIPANPVPARAAVERAMARLARAVCAARHVLLVIAIAVIALSAWGVTKIVFRDNFAAYFDDSFAFRQATVLYESRVGGITPVEFSVAVGAGEDFASPSYVADIARFAGWARQRPEVASVSSVADVLLAGGRDYGLVDEQGVPRDDMSAGMLRDGLKGRGDDAGLQTMLGSDFADEAAGTGATRVIVVLRDAAADVLLEFAADAEAELARLGEARKTTATGMAVLGAHLSQRNGAAMVRGTPLALAAISLLMVAMLGSWRLGLASLVPNLMPLLMAYGAWGIVMGELTFAGTMVIAMTFGIVVDDTVHIMSRYHYHRRNGRSPQEAMVETFRTVGIAVVTTTIAIAIGFSVLAASGFRVNRDLGMITTATLVSALAATLFFLPPLLLLLDRGGKRRRH